MLFILYRTILLCSSSLFSLEPGMILNDHSTISLSLSHWVDVVQQCYPFPFPLIKRVSFIDLIDDNLIHRRMDELEVKEGRGTKWERMREREGEKGRIEE